MHSIKRIFTLILTGAFFISGTAYAETSQIDSMQQQQAQNNAVVEQTEQKVQQLQQDMQKVQQELQTWDKAIAETNSKKQQAEKRLLEAQRLIEQKKMEIVQLENQVYMRKDIMKERLLAEQSKQSTHLIIEALVGSDSLANLLDRINAVSVILTADKEIMQAQQRDLARIEKEKEALTEQEKVAQEETNTLAALEAEQQQNQQKRQALFQALQANITNAQQLIATMQQKNEKLSASIQQMKEEAERQRQEQLRQQQKPPVAKGNEGGTAPAGGREMLVEATAYSWEESPPGQYITRWGGYNVKETPNAKIIAVDPNVIPLGSRVWVENYGIAIAADTGGAIKGYKIDVLKPSGDAARQWGRRYVKLKILD